MLGNGCIFVNLKISQQGVNLTFCMSLRGQQNKASRRLRKPFARRPYQHVARDPFESAPSRNFYENGSATVPSPVCPNQLAQRRPCQRLA